ncbi:UNVERIFIED_CONTAM: 28S ribosomal protein S14 [Trichonephila clavipes]
MLERDSILEKIIPYENCHFESILQPSLVPIRSKYTDWRMLRDVKRRKVVKEYAKLRLQINAVRYNTLLPKEIKEIAQKEIEALPTDSCTTKLHKRCILTSRPRGRYRKFRMSRIIWRHLADYNQISGVERAMW